MVWTIPSPWRPTPLAAALGAARLVSTPSLSGLARGCHLTGFPEFEQFCVPGFPRAHSNDLQVRCDYHSATPAHSKVWPPPSRPLKFDEVASVRSLVSIIKNDDTYVASNNKRYLIRNFTPLLASVDIIPRYQFEARTDTHR